MNMAGEGVEETVSGAWRGRHRGRILPTLYTTHQKLTLFQGTLETFFIPQKLKRRAGGAYKETFLKLFFLTLSKKTTNFATPLEGRETSSEF